MSNYRPKRESMSLEEATLSNMWEIAAIVEVLEREGRTIEMGQRVRRGRCANKEAAMRSTLGSWILRVGIGVMLLLTLSLFPLAMTVSSAEPPRPPTDVPDLLDINTATAEQLRERRRSNRPAIRRECWIAKPVEQDSLSWAGYFILQISQPASIQHPIIVSGTSYRTTATDWNI